MISVELFKRFLYIFADIMKLLRKNTLDKSFLKKGYSKPTQNRTALPICAGTPTTVFPARTLLGLDSDTFYIYHVAAVMVDNLRRLLLGINLSDKAIMDFDFPGVGFPV